MTCKECVHYAVCEAFAKKGIPRVDPLKCRFFKAVSAFVEQNQGKWLTWGRKLNALPARSYQKLGVFCSACEMHADEQYDYCPHCGAKMDGREIHNAD